MYFFPLQSKLEQTSKESFELLYKEIHEVCVCVCVCVWMSVCMDVWDCIWVCICVIHVCLCHVIALV